MCGPVLRRQADPRIRQVRRVGLRRLDLFGEQRLVDDVFKGEWPYRHQTPNEAFAAADLAAALQETEPKPGGCAACGTRWDDVTKPGSLSGEVDDGACYAPACGVYGTMRDYTGIHERNQRERAALRGEQ